MRKLLFDAQNFPSWAKQDERYKRLEELDRYLDGEIYDDLDHVFYDEETSTGEYIKIKRRRPAVRFNLYAAVADQIARECFAGFNAPVLKHPKENVRKFFDAIKEETEILPHMIEITNWATVGSAVATFKVVATEDGKAKAVMKPRKSKECTPFFNDLDELDKLRVHYVVSGSELLTQGVSVDFKDKPLKPTSSYWFIRDYGAKEEVTYYPIPESQWKPMDVMSDRLIPLLAHPTNLSFVPAHWFKRRTGKIRPYDGRCVWEQAIPNVVEFDYSMSQMGAGVRYNACPQVVIKGNLANKRDDGAMIGGPARYLQFQADRKTDDGLQETGANAHLLEATGAGMQVGIEHYGRLLREIAILVICASRKDPNKITTAMSAKGMEVLDKEYHNLIQEFRTVCGDNGYLKLLKKIGAACILAKHPLAKGITLEDIDALTLKWPPINPVGAQEFLYLCQGIVAILQEADPGATPGQGAQGGESKPAQGAPPAGTLEPKEEKEPVMKRDELRSYLISQIDLGIDSSNRDYLIGKPKEGHVEVSPLSDEEKASMGADGTLRHLAESAVKSAREGVVDTSFKVGEG